MTPAYLRAALASLVEAQGGDPEDQTQRARVVGLARSTLASYESGGRPIPPMLARYVRAEHKRLRWRRRYARAAAPSEAPAP